MKIEVKLLTQMKPYLPDPGLAGSIRFLEVQEGARIMDLFVHLGLPPDIPKVILLNDRQGKLDDILEAGDRVTVFPPVGGG